MPARPRYEVGDGDPCPLFPEHGKMVTIPGTKKQYCPHVEHVQHKDRPATRAIWPLEDGALAAAIAEARAA